MGKTLIITEKPSVAREYADILEVKNKNKGYYENDSYVITWCVGHLIEMCYPEKYDEKYKKWRMEDLPFLPETYKYEVIKNVKDQYKIVHDMMNSKDISTILYAGDSGREGEVIIELIRRYGGVRSGMEEKRVWIDSCTEDEIRRGIREAKPIEAYDNLANAGIMRGIEDYAMGINFSRALSIKYGGMLNRQAGTKKYSAIAIGRVMTCVLGMVVEREREIRDFTVTPFYRIIGSFGKTDGSKPYYEGEWRLTKTSPMAAGTDEKLSVSEIAEGNPALYSEKGFKKEEDARRLIESLDFGSAKVLSRKHSLEKKNPPLLFNLAELQAECTKKFHISPDQTLSVAQALYESKLTTYPRTDARVLTIAIAAEITKNLGGLYRYEPVKEYILKIREEGRYKDLSKTQYVDDSKVTDHYAIIPTGNVSELARQSELNKKVYDLIVRRFLSVFYPPAVYEKENVTTGVERKDGSGHEEFFTQIKVLKEPGFFEISGMPEKGGDDLALASFLTTLSKGMNVSVKEMNVKEGKTTPPKRYTSGSMILAMENAGQLIEDEELRAQIKGAGIGTSATRAGIIEKLVKIGYLGLNKKTQVLTPKLFGEMVYEVVRLTIPSMLKPVMTASWEKGLASVERGEITDRDYRNKLYDYVKKYTGMVEQRDISTSLMHNLEIVKKINEREKKS